MEMSDNTGIVSAKDAAEELATTYPRILMLLREGALEGVHEGDELFVTRDSLVYFRSHGSDAGVRIACGKMCGGCCGNH